MYIYTSNLIVASLFAIASSFTAYAAPLNSSTPLTTIESESDFCLFLPPQPGLVVAVNEDNGIPFCTNTSLVPNATEFPEGFITTAHYLRNSSYVQVTGFFDRSKYDLGETDGGGQYDNHAHGKPTGAHCQDYNYFVSMIEPDIERFCIRCCQDEVKYIYIYIINIKSNFYSFRLIVTLEDQVMVVFVSLMVITIMITTTLTTALQTQLHLT